MNDHPTPETGADTSGAVPAPNPSAEIIATVTSIITDLSDIVAEFPAPGGNAEFTARQLDRLSEELAQAAGWLRQSRRP